MPDPIRDKPVSPVPLVVPVNLPALIHPDESGGYWAEVPALPGCVSEGDTVEEVVANIREAAEGWLNARHEIMDTEKRKALEAAGWAIGDAADFLGPTEGERDWDARYAYCNGSPSLGDMLVMGDISRETYDRAVAQLAAGPPPGLAERWAERRAAKGRPETTDAAEILRRRYVYGKPEMEALLEEERAKTRRAPMIPRCDLRWLLPGGLACLATIFGVVGGGYLGMPVFVAGIIGYTFVAVPIASLCAYMHERPEDHPRA